MDEGELRDPSAADERFDSIPWDALVVDDRQRRRRVGALIVAAVVVLGAAVGLTRLVVNADQPSGEGVGNAPAASSPGSPVTSSEVIDTPPFTESDLLAGDDPADRAAAMAAWFVSDYFTLDGSDITRQMVEDRLPPGVVLPEPDGTERSFVETAIPIEAEALADGRYRIVLVVRTLAAADGERYVRQPARAVEVVVSVSSSGFSVLDLPAPMALPTAEPAPLDVDEADPPAGVLDAARARAEAWGRPSETVLSAGTVGSMWRIVLEVVDPADMRWPVAVWVTADGEVTTAGP